MSAARDLDEALFESDPVKAAELFRLLPPGAEIVYHTGRLAADRFQAPAAIRLNAIAYLFWRLGRGGEAVLYQRPAGTTLDEAGRTIQVFQYRARKARARAAGPAAPAGPVVIWNRGNERRLLALWEAGASCVAIAADLGCSSASVSWRVRQLGLKRGVAVAPAALFAASPVAPPPAAASKGHAA